MASLAILGYNGIDLVPGRDGLDLWPSSSQAQIVAEHANSAYYHIQV